MTVKMSGSFYTILPAAGDLPRLALTAPDGARAGVYLYGAHVASWVPAGGEERLFMSRRSQFRLGAPIRGGVPVVFPQFGASGPLPLHGLARLMPWEFAGVQIQGPRVMALFRLVDTEDSYRQWAHHFDAELAVCIGGSLMEIRLVVTNTGTDIFEFTTSFHTYLSVTDVAQVTVEGLLGFHYRDAAAGGIEKVEHAGQVGFTGEVNRIYFHAAPEARLYDGDRRLGIRKAGFTDTVVWNPGADKCANMPDLEPEDYRRFVCVEAATVGVPVILRPGEKWEGKQSLEG